MKLAACQSEIGIPYGLTVDIVQHVKKRGKIQSSVLCDGRGTTGVKIWNLHSFMLFCQKSLSGIIVNGLMDMTEFNYSAA
jgi:hypothetical protein